MSDLHTEVEYHNVAHFGVPDDVDFALCAGDIARGGKEHVTWLQENIAPHTRSGVVSVLGNHEFYRSSIESERLAAGRAAAWGDVRVLDDMTWTTGGVRFVGATLWTDYMLFNPNADPILLDSHMYVARSGLNDHRLIRLVDSSSRPFIPQHAREIHRKSVAYIESVLSTPFNGETIVVTHHGPARGSIGERYKNDSLTAAYISNLEPLIAKYQPALWYHGHVHESFDYNVGNTRVMTNPKGYRLENRHGFNPQLVVEIGEPAPKPRVP
ncbi:metallophosphoesterase [Devosia faecipullorum]|uniref:metallophosphoesterase n=1 Tax=Devosia faecipullorum TaxID=2755039 RepID=UPI00187B44D3|nr:metallophosphoesterase [Devosia faecipullorum]MBE7732141.1 metallophosphoesterase [Devosia faecipullorum]